VDCFSEILSKLVEDQRRGEIEVRMLVHQSHAGAIIGRGGSKIKELREQTKAQLKVFKDCCPGSTDRVLLITTDRSGMADAVKIMIDFLKEIPIKGTQKQYDASHYDPSVDYGGFIDKNFHFGGNSRGPPMSTGSFDSYRGPPSYGGPVSGYGRQPGQGGPLPLSSHGGGYMQESITTTQVTIPNELGGTIIGKGGERINHIRGESGAKIDIGDAFGTEERIITISGTPHQIQTAQYLLQQSVRMSESGRRYLREQR